MAIIQTEGKKVTVTDGESVVDACEQLGVPFGCREGVCGTCMTTVLEGMENLSEPTQNEIVMGILSPERLMCQCRIQGGVVKIYCPY